jgi:hypothetical protein
MVAFSSYPDRVLAMVLSAETAIDAPREFTAGLQRALADLVRLAGDRAVVPLSGKSALEQV